jgi:PAS domain S-box-containing protein
MHIQIRESFLAETADPAQFTRLFEHVPGLAFFAKNRALQLVLANRTFYERLGFASESELTGKNDFELFPKPLALKFRADDQRVLSSGEALEDIVELFLSPQGSTDWFITQKLPVLTPNGSPCGVMGIVQRYDPRRTLRPGDPAVSRAADLLRDDPGRAWKLAELARTVGLSQRHFDRRFKECFGVTPQSYLLKTRIEFACDTLREPSAHIAEVASLAGFYDQSAFTAQFRRHMGITPLRYQKQFRASCTAQGRITSP